MVVAAHSTPPLQRNCKYGQAPVSLTRRPKILHQAIVAALALGMISSAGLVMAQSPERDDARTLDAVSVTGSRITVPGVEASSPVASVERSEFLATQQVSLEMFLKEFPALTPSIGPAKNTGVGGGATIDMRGLGDNRTLILVDGRRPVPFNLDSVVDINTIPMALLQSVDILTGGASVVYGADTVAGVANFLLRRDFEGAEFNVNWGRSKYHDGTRQNYEATFGALSDDGRANAVLSIGYTELDRVTQGARPWSTFSVDSRTGRFAGSNTTTPTLIGFPGLGALLGNPSSNWGQVNPASGELGPIFQQYNYNPLNTFQAPLERWQATGLARYEISPRAEAYGQVSYTRSMILNENASTGIYSQLISVPLANPYIPDGVRQQICAGFSIDPASCNSGRDADGNLIYRDITFNRRLSELGARPSDFITKTFQTTLGLRGALSDHWNYDGYWSYGESDQVFKAANTASMSRFRQAMDAISKTECVDATGGCVPIDAFGDHGTMSEEMLDFIRLDAYRFQYVEQTNATFNLDGNLGRFKSPWADYPVGVAAGVEYRRTVAGNNSDASFLADGEIMGYNQTPNSRGGFTLKEAYLESIIPLVSGRTGIENLSLELGYRHSEFSNTGGFDDHYGSWKYGFTWMPVDSVKLRAMQQRATRAPNIAELFRPEVSGQSSANTDPCAGNAINLNDINTPGTLSWLCVQTGVPVAAVGGVPQPNVGQVKTRIRGNPELEPEKADTTTLGVVWTPSERFSVTLDYWNIEIEDTIDTLTIPDVLVGCYDPSRNPGYIINDMCVLASGRHPINGDYDFQSPGIALVPSNSGFRQKSGYDLGVRFGHALPGTLGRLQYAWDLSKVTRDDYQASPTSILRDCLGYYGTSCSPSHDLRSNLRTVWAVNDFSVSLAWRYWGSIKVEPLSEINQRFFEAYRKIPSYNYFDLGASWNAPWHLTISVTVNNALDKKPPVVGSTIGFLNDNGGNTFPAWYDALGRYYNLGISFRF